MAEETCWFTSRPMCERNGIKAFFFTKSLIYTSQNEEALINSAISSSNTKNASGVDLVVPYILGLHNKVPSPGDIAGSITSGTDTPLAVYNAIDACMLLGPQFYDFVRNTAESFEKRFHVPHHTAPLTSMNPQLATEAYSRLLRKTYQVGKRNSEDIAGQLALKATRFFAEWMSVRENPTRQFDMLYQLAEDGLEWDALVLLMLALRDVGGDCSEQLRKDLLSKIAEGFPKLSPFLTQGASKQNNVPVLDILFTSVQLVKKNSQVSSITERIENQVDLCANIRRLFLIAISNGDWVTIQKAAEVIKSNLEPYGFFYEYQILLFQEVLAVVFDMSQIVFKLAGFDVPALKIFENNGFLGNALRSWEQIKVFELLRHDGRFASFTHFVKQLISANTLNSTNTFQINDERKIDCLDFSLHFVRFVLSSIAWELKKGPQPILDTFISTSRSSLKTPEIENIVQSLLNNNRVDGLSTFTNSLLSKISKGLQLFLENTTTAKSSSTSVLSYEQTQTSKNEFQRLIDGGDGDNQYRGKAPHASNSRSWQRYNDRDRKDVSTAPVRVHVNFPFQNNYENIQGFYQDRSGYKENVTSDQMKTIEKNLLFFNQAPIGINVGVNGDSDCRAVVTSSGDVPQSPIKPFSVEQSMRSLFENMDEKPTATDACPTDCLLTYPIDDILTKEVANLSISSSKSSELSVLPAARESKGFTNLSESMEKARRDLMENFTDAISAVIIDEDNGRKDGRAARSDGETTDTEIIGHEVPSNEEVNIDESKCDPEVGSAIDNKGTNLEEGLVGKLDNGVLEQNGEEYRGEQAENILDQELPKVVCASEKIYSENEEYEKTGSKGTEEVSIEKEYVIIERIDNGDEGIDQVVIPSENVTTGSSASVEKSDKLESEVNQIEKKIENDQSTKSVSDGTVEDVVAAEFAASLRSDSSNSHLDDTSPGQRRRPPRWSSQQPHKKHALPPNPGATAFGGAFGIGNGGNSFSKSGSFSGWGKTDKGWSNRDSSTPNVDARYSARGSAFRGRGGPAYRARYPEQFRNSDYGRQSSERNLNSYSEKNDSSSFDSHQRNRDYRATGDAGRNNSKFVRYDDDDTW